MVAPHVTRRAVFKKLSIKHPEQDDSYNCGAFVLFFMQSFMRGAEKAFLANLKEQTFKPNEYRTYVLSLLLEHSMSLYDFCSTCGCKSKSEELNRTEEGDARDWIACDFCFRWYHLQKTCIRDPKVDVLVAQRNPSETEFVCFLCKANFNIFSVGRLNFLMNRQLVYDRLKKSF